MYLTGTRIRLIHVITWKKRKRKGKKKRCGRERRGKLARRQRGLERDWHRFCNNKNSRWSRSDPLRPERREGGQIEVRRRRQWISRSCGRSSGQASRALSSAPDGGSGSTPSFAVPSRFPSSTTFLVCTYSLPIYLK